MKRQFTNNFKRKIFIFLLVVVGLLLRLWGSPKNFYWSSDVARDFLVGSHILHYKELLSLGHTAAGFGEPFYYPPYTYYLLALLQTIFPTPEQLIGFFVIIHALSVPLFVYAVALLFGWPSALLAGLFMTLSAKMIDLSRLMLVTPALPILYVAAILCILAIKRKSHKHLILGLFCALYASMFHYSALLYIPLAYLFWILSLKKKKPFHTFVPPVFVSIVFLISQMPLIIFFGFREFLWYMQPSSNFVLRIGNMPQKFFVLVFQYWNMIFTTDALLGLLVIATISLIVIFRSRHIKFLYPVLIMIGFLGYAIGVMAIMKVTIPEHFFTYFFPLFFLICGYLFGQYWQSLPKNTLGYSMFILPLLAFSFAISGRFIYLTSSQPLGIGQSVAIAQRVSAYIKERVKTDSGFQNSFHFYVSGPNSPIWGTSTVLYYLENELQRKLIRLADKTTSIEQENDDQYIIVACRYLTDDFLKLWNLTSEEWNTRVCIRNFQEKFRIYKKYSVVEIPDSSVYDARLFLFSSTN